jgi:hypothetical protein
MIFLGRRQEFVGQIWAQRHGAVAAALLGLGSLQAAYLAYRGQVLESRLEALALALAVGLGALVAAGTVLRPAWGAAIGAIAARLGRRRLSWPLLIIACWTLTFGPLGRFVEPWAIRAALYWLVALVAAPALAGWWRVPTAGARLAATLLVLGAGHRIWLHLPEISTYPLALGWSETSRYYYGSLWFSEAIYGTVVPPSVLHPGRYLLQAVPFLVSRHLLWLHRAWQVVLWLGLPALAGLLLSRRLPIQLRWLRWLLVLWAFLFLLQGPVLFHLVVPVVIVLAGFRSERPVLSLLVVVLASAWAGISRINWIPVPGFLAATIYLLETRPRGHGWLREVVWPTVWIVPGSVTALGANAAYILLSGNRAGDFSSSFTSDLLWYRLLPNPTFLPGILLGVALVSLPVAWLLIERQPMWRNLPTIRLLALGSMLAVLLLGGILVSVKIGGGSNLHNMDAYLVLLLLIGAYLFAGLPAPDRAAAEPSWSLAALAIAIPLGFTLSVGGPLHWPDPAQGETVIAELQQELDGPAGEGQILFISERHLLTFGNLQAGSLAPEHEKVFLMEMAMGNTRSYLDAFERDLAEQRFALIVSEPLHIQYQGSSRAFGEENDVWVDRVAIPILCFYQPVRTFTQAPIELLVPRPGGRQCPAGGG